MMQNFPLIILCRNNVEIVTSHCMYFWSTTKIGPMQGVDIIICRAKSKYPPSYLIGKVVHAELTVEWQQVTLINPHAISVTHVPFFSRVDQKKYRPAVSVVIFLISYQQFIKFSKIQIREHPVSGEGEDRVGQGRGQEVVCHCQRPGTIEMGWSYRSFHSSACHDNVAQFTVS